jgi:hypothetical protein
VTLGELLRLTIKGLEGLQIPYAIVGSFASGVWGQPRMTLDIDIVIRLGAERIDDFCSLFSGDQFYLSRQAVDEAVSLRRPFHVIHLDSSIKVDFMVVGNSGWNRTQLARRVKLELLPGVSGHVASPKDVILGKLVYFHEGHSEKNVLDILGIIKSNSSQLDRANIEEQAPELGVADVWRETQRKAVETWPEVAVRRMVWHTRQPPARPR